jgi:hypothetical protein
MQETSVKLRTIGAVYSQIPRANFANVTYLTAEGSATIKRQDKNKEFACTSSPHAPVFRLRVDSGERCVLLVPGLPVRAVRVVP